MTIVGFVSWVVVAVLSAQGCANGDQTLSASGTSTPGADTTRAQTGFGAARDMVLRARAFDRADQLDSARVLYAEAARRAPVVSDWLYLRAAGVSTERSTRDDYLDEIETPVARDRRGVTAALALERSGDIDGAIAAYTASDERLAARHQVVAGEAVGQVEDVALLADAGHIGAEHDLGHAPTSAASATGASITSGSTASCGCSVRGARCGRGARSVTVRVA